MEALRITFKSTINLSLYLLNELIYLMNVIFIVFSPKFNQNSLLVSIYYYLFIFFLILVFYNFFQINFVKCILEVF